MPTYRRPAATVTYDREKQAAAGRKGGVTRHSPATYARSIAKRWPELSEEARAELRAILAPLTALTADASGGETK